ncbi:MAG TPA: hypothetical protein PLX56_06305 [bacterium]|nr:hypothetical protein [bacterium]HQO91922.1 hypothetical protein [bacterium]
MSEENKILDKGSDVKPELTADFIKWQKMKEIDTKLDKMIQEKPEFKAIVDAGLREAVHKIPQLLEIPDLFAEKVQSIAEKLMKDSQAKTTDPKAADLKTDSKKETDNENPAAQKPVVFKIADGYDPQKHYCPKLESEETLRKMGYSEVGIALVKAF